MGWFGRSRSELVPAHGAVQPSTVIKVGQGSGIAAFG